MKRQQSPRFLAINILQQVLPAKGQGSSLRQLLADTNAEALSAADKGLLQDLCFGVCRHWRLLNHWLDSNTRKPIKPSGQRIRLAICAGLYELWFTKRQAHAIVNAWPDVARALKQQWAVGLINALLRNASRSDAEQWIAAQPLAVQTSLPQWLVDSFRNDWPEQAEEIARASVSNPPMTLRANRLQTTPEKLLSLFQDAGIYGHSGEVSTHSLYLDEALSVSNVPGFFDGSCSVQDEAAQMPVAVMQVPDSGRILDACAAPGGKTGQLLECWPNASVHALDLEPNRLAMVESNLARLGLSAQLMAGDACQPEGWWDGEQYDAILLDAPCSATGILRRQPDGKWHKTAEDVDRLSQLQAKLLQTLWPLVKAGGCLVYATCSINKAENSQQITHFLANNADAQHTTPALSVAVSGETGNQLLPTKTQWDGFYYARLTKAK